MNLQSSSSTHVASAARTETPGKVLQVARRNLELPTQNRSRETIDGGAVPETSHGAMKAHEQNRTATGRKGDGWKRFTTTSTRDFMDHGKPQVQREAPGPAVPQHLLLITPKPEPLKSWWGARGLWGWDEGLPN